jgi:hypothetical protein
MTLFAKRPSPCGFVSGDKNSAGEGTASMTVPGTVEIGYGEISTKSDIFPNSGATIMRVPPVV